MLLLLFSILSFYRLIKYIKNPTKNNALFFGVFSALMIHSHFFGLFTFASQIIILFLFFIFSEKQNKKAFIINSLISGLTVLLLFLPIVKIFINVTKVKEFWIPAPTADSYTLIFKEFFGNSEMLLTLLSLIIVLYFIKLSKEKDNAITYKSIVENKIIFSFVILIPWIIVVVLIPLIRSHISVPMLISRYFIVLLPAITLLIAISINEFNNKIVKYGIVSIFIVFSLTDIIVVKKYYKTVVKTQFKESTQFILNNNSLKDNIVSSLGWYLPYFLNNEKYKNNIIDKSLDSYVSEMVLDNSKIKSFWYFDGHIRPFAPSEATKVFLNQHFIVDKNVDLYDCYTKHFILKKDFKPNLDISNYIPLKPTNGDKLNYSFEVFDSSTDKISLSGWAYFEGLGMENARIDIVAIKENVPKAFPIESVKRDDVTDYFKSAFNLSNSGFKAEIYKANFEKGNYQIGVLIQDLKNNKKGLVVTDKIFLIE